MQRGEVGDLLILSRLNPFFYDEVMAFFYRKKTLCFAIHTANDEWTVPGLEGAEPVDFRRVEFGRFQKIKVNLYAPTSHDKAQVLRMRTQLSSLVCMLARLQYVLRDDGVGRDKPQHPQILLDRQGQEGWPAAPAGHRLPDMEIEFADQECTTWGRDTWLWRWIFLDGDFIVECILGIFEFLRGCPTATIIVPAQLSLRRGIDDDDDYDAAAAAAARLDAVFQNVIACMEYDKPFGTGRHDHGIRLTEYARTIFFGS